MNNLFNVFRAFAVVDVLHLLPRWLTRSNFRSCTWNRSQHSVHQFPTFTKMMTSKLCKLGTTTSAIKMPNVPTYIDRILDTQPQAKRQTGALGCATIMGAPTQGALVSSSLHFDRFCLFEVPVGC